MDISLENLYLDIGAERVNNYYFLTMNQERTNKNYVSEKKGVYKMWLASVKEIVLTGKR